ncbi:hypothetical protein HDU96_004644 [Phlyctochytrium bullatum]|nr:hypothetical protein HDU96_004644 [Phlyctochytrium bullatum]
MSKSEVLGLYRAFLRVQRQWPAQEGRKNRLSLYIRDKVRNDFRQHAKTPETEAKNLLAKATSELEALKYLADGRCEKESGGSSNNGRTSQPKMLGVKRGQGAMVKPGDIIIRQRGTKWNAGPGVGLGRDHTLYCVKPGRVVFRYDLGTQKRIVAIVSSTGASKAAIRRNDIDEATSAVGEAPLPGSGSRAEAKARLIEALDPKHYLSLNHFDRYKYVLETSKKLVEEDQQRQTNLLSKRLLQPKRGPMNLVDLTLL